MEIKTKSQIMLEQASNPLSTAHSNGYRNKMNNFPQSNQDLTEVAEYAGLFQEKHPLLTLAGSGNTSFNSKTNHNSNNVQR